MPRDDAVVQSSVRRGRGVCNMNNNFSISLAQPRYLLGSLDVGLCVWPSQARLALDVLAFEKSSPGLNHFCLIKATSS